MFQSIEKPICLKTILIIKCIKIPNPINIKIWKTHKDTVYIHGKSTNNEKNNFKK